MGRRITVQATHETGTSSRVSIPNAVSAEEDGQLRELHVLHQQRQTHSVKGKEKDEEEGQHSEVDTGEEAKLLQAPNMPRRQAAVESPLAQVMKSSFSQSPPVLLEGLPGKLTQLIRAVVHGQKSKRERTGLCWCYAAVHRTSRAPYASAQGRRRRIPT